MRYGSTEFQLDGTPLVSRSSCYLQYRQPDLDSVEEVSVENNNVSAKYNSPVAVVASTKSGTNQLHGALFHTDVNSRVGGRAFAGRFERPGVRLQPGAVKAIYMEKHGTNILTLDHASIQQDKKNELYTMGLFNALRKGYLIVEPDDGVLEDTYLKLCTKEGGPGFAVFPWGCISVSGVLPEDVDRLLAVAEEHGAHIWENPGIDGMFVVYTDDGNAPDVALAPALAVQPAAGGPAEEGETIAEVGGVTLTRLRLNSLARAFIAGFLTLDFSAPDRICRLYNNARCSRQRPSVFIMPHWENAEPW